MTNAVIEIENIDKKLGRNLDSDSSTSACLFNLIVYTHEELRTEYFQNLSRSIAQQFPCRIISITANMTTHESFFKVKASKETAKKSNAAIVYDHIAIESSASEIDRIPFIVIPHLVPDLSVYLIWGQDPTSGNDILAILKKYVSRLIIDSQCTHNLPQFAHKIAAQIQDEKIEIVDMNWAQIINWRDIFLQVFDNEEKIQELRKAQKMIIQYFTPHYKNILGHSSIQAIYLQGWIASQLEWVAKTFGKKDSGYFITYQTADDEKIEIELQVLQQEGYGVQQIEIFTGNQGNYLLQFEPKLQRVCVNYSTKDRCDLPFNIPFVDGKKGHTLMNEIFFQPLSDQYVHMLNKIKNFDW